MTTPNELMLKARAKFISDSRDLLALMKNLTVDELTRKMASAMELNPDFTEELLLHSDPSYLSQLGPAGRAAREAFSNAAYRSICQSFLKVQRNAQVIVNCRLADFPEAYAQLDAIEIAAGERRPAPPPPPQRSAQEQLEDQVRDDWRKLPTDKLKTKMNRDPEYRQAFDRLMAANQLESQCTSLHDGGAEFRP